MILNKKLKYILGSVGLLSLIGLPASLSLTSCSKKSDKIDYYKQADDSIFEGIHMGKDASPFMCDFNVSKKTCAIVDWLGNEPNYMTTGLPVRDGLSDSLNKKINNTIRIPSQVVYKNEIYNVVSFGTILSWPPNNMYEGNLDLGNIMSNTIQIIEFDPNLIIKSDDDYYRGGDIIDYPGDIKQPNLLQVLNYNNIILKSLKNSKKLEIITGDWAPRDIEGCSSLKSIPPLYNYVDKIYDNRFYGCSSLQKINIPNSVQSIGFQAFAYCSSLTEIIIPDSVKSIDTNAFFYCSSLKSITFPNSIVYYGTNIISGPHPEGFKIYFHSQEQLDLFLKENSSQEQYCEVI